MIDKNKLSIDKHFRDYLKTVEYDLDKMSGNQYIQLRRAFYAGVSSLMVLQSDYIADLDIEDSTTCIQSLSRQCLDFWDREVKRDP